MGLSDADMNKGMGEALGKYNNPYGLRSDGTAKGQGFLGPIQRPDGRVSTELGIGVELDGRELQIPTMVPTLDKDELDYLINTPEDKLQEIDPDRWKGIINKSVDHAKERMKQGLSPFYD